MVYFVSENQKERLFINNTAFEIVDKYTNSNGVVHIQLKEK